MKLLGIDYGEAKIGLALGDTESRMSLPYKIIKNNGWQSFIVEVYKLCQEEKIEKIIIGLPQNTQNETVSVGEEKVRELVKEIEARIELPVEFELETLSTQAAQKLSPGKNDDDIAAMIILQSYIDKN
ncbi:MAG: Holliday junction resolvase RuvX [bacterium]